MVRTVCIVGIGLIGGSLAAGLRKHQWCESVIGIDANQKALDDAIQLNIIDEGYKDIASCPVVPDVLVIAVPVLKIKDVFESITPWIDRCQAITDVGSTKQNVVDAFNDTFPSKHSSVRFVPGHPIAGREKSGVTAAVADLFVDRKVILTPMDNVDEQSVKLVSEMWEQVGAHVELLNPKEHDTILAATSHLPHALAFSLVHCLSTQSHTPEIFRYAAGGFADFSRIASSDPVVWREICLANRNELLNAITHFDQSLQQMRTCLEDNDGDALEKIFSDAKNARDRYANS